eukprot:1783654-Prymnesium_polylepis.4
MMIWDNLIHADLHPGNVLIRMEEIGDAAARGDTGTEGSGEGGLEERGRGSAARSRWVAAATTTASQPLRPRALHHCAAPPFRRRRDAQAGWRGCNGGWCSATRRGACHISSSSMRAWPPPSPSRSPRASTTFSTRSCRQTARASLGRAILGLAPSQPNVLDEAAFIAEVGAREGSEGGREGARKGGRERGREGARERGSEGAREGGMEGASERARETRSSHTAARLARPAGVETDVARVGSVALCEL